MTDAISPAILKELDYDFNVNLFLGKTSYTTMRSMADQQKILKWFKKLTISNHNENELRLRNDFMYYLVNQIENKELRPPFDKDPPCEPLVDLAKLLPGGVEPPPEKGKFPGDSTRNKAPEPMPLVFAQSPDGGAFLAAQPVPRRGTFCYVTIAGKGREK